MSHALDGPCHENQADLEQRDVQKKTRITLPRGSRAEKELIRSIELPRNAESEPHAMEQLSSHGAGNALCLGSCSTAASGGGSGCNAAAKLRLT
jgi:hypothetical protein